MRWSWTSLCSFSILSAIVYASLWISTVAGSDARSNVNLGRLVYTTSNGHLSVDWFFMLLKANSACARDKSHCLGLEPLRQRIKLPSVLLVTLVYPSVWGWAVVLYFSVVSNFFHRVFQKWLRNLTSLLETIVLGIPCNPMTSLKKRLATYMH